MRSGGLVLWLPFWLSVCCSAGARHDSRGRSRRGCRWNSNTPGSNSRNEYFYTKRPVRLIAKVDRVYKDERATHFVTELKRRVKTQVYLSDVVELSAQKVAIERGSRRSAAEIGFVVIEHPVTQKRTPIPVQLLREQEIIALATRYERLIVGGAMPDKANVAGLCRSCAYADRCRPEVLSNTSDPRRTRHAR
jgi:CRISPR-associated exonuclease Cas4